MEITTAQHLLASLATDNAISAEIHERREFALEILPRHLLEFDCVGLAFDQLAAAWMMCSYGQTERKHRIKPVINELLRREMAIAKIDTGPGIPHRTSVKPHVLVVSSFLRSNHAVWRWFGPSLARLRERFQTTALCFTDLDDKAASAFDRAIVARMQRADFIAMTGDLFKLVRDIGPDIIVFADIAMHPFGIMMANARLAPLQIALSGHPASSYSDCVDFFACERPFSDTLSDFTELPALYPVAQMIGLPDTSPTEREPGPLRILVPTTLPKLVRPFVETLGIISNQLPGAQIHITTNARDQHFEIAKIEILKLVPGASVYPALPQESFAFLIRQSDMFLSPFPFAGSTTINDCLSHKVPGVAMTGDEMLQRQGAEQLRRFNVFAPQTVAATQAEYIEKAVAMARDVHLRSYFGSILRDTPRESLIIHTSPSNGLAATVERIYNERLDRREMAGSNRVTSNAIPLAGSAPASA